MSLGLLIMAFGALLFVPAAKMQIFSLFLFAQLVMGTGQTLLQTAINPYVIKLGPEESAAVRISIMGLLNKAAGIIAPLVFTVLILNKFNTKIGTVLTTSDTVEMIEHLIMPYLIMACILFIISVIIFMLPIPDIREDKAKENTNSLSIFECFRHPNLTLGIMALFLYVGIEVIAADTVGTFALSLNMANYSSMTAYTMVFMVLGYLLGIVLIPRYLNQQQALSLSAILGIIISIAVLVSSPHSYWIATQLKAIFSIVPVLSDTLCFIIFLGFANAIIWPAIWPLALSGLGALTSIASGLLVMGIAGGAILPLIWGLLSDTVLGMHYAYAILIPCYTFILFYALKGHLLKQSQ